MLSKLLSVPSVSVYLFSTHNPIPLQYLMAFYLFLAERHGTGVGSRWALMGLAVKLGISVSLYPPRTPRICLLTLTRSRIDGASYVGS